MLLVYSGLAPSHAKRLFLFLPARVSLAVICRLPAAEATSMPGNFKCRSLSHVHAWIIIFAAGCDLVRLKLIATRDEDDAVLRGVFMRRREFRAATWLTIASVTCGGARWRGSFSFLPKANAFVRSIEVPKPLMAVNGPGRQRVVRRYGPRPRASALAMPDPLFVDSCMKHRISTAPRQCPSLLLCSARSCCVSRALQGTCSPDVHLCRRPATPQWHDLPAATDSLPRIPELDDPPALTSWIFDSARDDAHVAADTPGSESLLESCPPTGSAAFASSPCR